MYVVDRNKNKPGRKSNLYIRHYVAGKPVDEKVSGGVKAAAAQMAEIKRQLKSGTWIHPKLRKSATMTFADFAPRVVEKRTAMGVGKHETPPNKTERGHVVNHLIPVFGKYTLPELSFKVIKHGFQGTPEDSPELSRLRINNKGLAGRMVRNIHSTLRTVLLEAVEEELIDTPPPPLQVARDHIPPPIDKDPTWRPTAKFDRREVGKLAACDEIATHRRALYVTYFLTGPRFTELNQQRVRDYNREMSPMPSLTVLAAKVGRHALPGQVRHVPVHPELQRWLDWWLDEEFEVLYGKPPEPDDYLFPTVSSRQHGKGIGYCTYQEIAYQFRENDLPAAGLASKRVPTPGVRRRERGMHDARRTFIGILRSSGADPDLIRAITHKGTSDPILDRYTHWQWDALCNALGKITLGLPPPPYRNGPPISLVTSRPILPDVSESSAFEGAKNDRKLSGAGTAPNKFNKLPK